MKKFLLLTAAILSLVACGKASDDIRIVFDVNAPVERTAVVAYHYNMVEGSLSIWKRGMRRTSLLTGMTSRGLSGLRETRHLL